MLKTLGIIPARIGSTRLPRKPLADIDGKSLIQRTYESCKKSNLLDTIVVATDSIEIIKHVNAFGGTAVMTNDHHQSGTLRAIEVAERNITNGFDIFVNIQGDNPILEQQHIDPLIIKLMNNPHKQLITTPVFQVNNFVDIFDPNCVKVVMNKDNDALYFSRSPMPFVRDTNKDLWFDKTIFWKHLGIYGFTTPAIVSLKNMKTSKLELSESLEQLTWLYYGMTISCIEVTKDVIAVDVKSDIDKVIAELNKNAGKS